ncbi:hypothetical protein HMPREF1868_00149 [Olsenella sp. DNF00959]|nr:hypothetical protein HMPREF1868_00149 [Olsenella sp. DNF00959]
MDGIRRAGSLAGAAGDAARVAELACDRAQVRIGAERQDRRLAGDYLDDPLRAGPRTEAAAYAGLAPHLRGVVLVEADRVDLAGGDTRTAADAAVVAVPAGSPPAMYDGYLVPSLGHIEPIPPE